MGQGRVDELLDQQFGHVQQVGSLNRHGVSACPQTDARFNARRETRRFNARRETRRFNARRETMLDVKHAGLMLDVKQC